MTSTPILAADAGSADRVEAGSRFGHLRFTGRAFRDKRHWFLECDCDCGQMQAVRADRWGKAAQCNACGSIARVASNTKHGLARTPEYRSWESMIYRCTSPKATGWEYYGGRGILVCPEWRDVTVFVRDMGSRPKGTSLDRIDNDGNYEPGNCRWATPSQQNANKRSPMRETVCRKGLHERSPENLYYNQRTQTYTCKPCAKVRANDRYQQVKATGAVA